MDKLKEVIDSIERLGYSSIKIEKLKELIKLIEAGGNVQLTIASGINKGKQV